MSFVDTNFITGEVSERTNAQTLAAEQEIAELYELYEQQISAYALRRASSADANDVVAETFLTAWRRRDDIPAEPKTLPWLYGVSRRVLANQRRSQDRRSRLKARLTREPTSVDSPVNLIESADAFGEVTAAIQAMSDDDAEILRLTAWEGLGPTEIAQSLGIEPPAARQRLFRARQRLTDQLDKQAAEKARREKMQKVTATVLALLVVLAGLVGSGLLRSDSVIETDLIDQDEGPTVPSESEIGDDDDKVDSDSEETARAFIEPDDDVSQIDAAIATPAEPPTELDAQQAQQTAEQTAPTTESPVLEEEPIPEQVVAPSSQPDTSPAEGEAETNGESAQQASDTAATTTPTTTQQAAAPAPLVATGPFVPGVDLFVFQLDFAALDDGHAAVATAEALADHGVCALVVAGTAAVDAEGHSHEYTTVMNATYGNGWVDAAQNNRATAIGDMADEWVATTDSGGDIWVAEGGVSDFTAEVLREVQQRRPELDTKSRVHVVHHIGRNIDTTQPDDLALIVAATDFIQIDDGNSNNGTADLYMPSAGFEAATAQSTFSAGWAAAFEAMPAAELDFSDTVTALYLLGVNKDQVATTDDFLRLFLS